MSPHPDRSEGARGRCSAYPQRIARGAVMIGLALVGLWILWPFLRALAWAAIFAIALWPSYARLATALAAPPRSVLLPLAATMLVGFAVMVPLGWLAIKLARETSGIVHYFATLRHDGLATPRWLSQLPTIGAPLGQWWQANLADPKAADQLFGRALAAIPVGIARQLGGEILHRITLFVFTLLTLFFLLRDGGALGRQFGALADRLLGPDAERLGQHMIAAVHATVNGLVLVGLAEGALLGIAYALAGLPHPVSIGAVTGVLAVIPFGAPLAFGGAALYLAALGSTVAAATVFGFGLAVVFVADHAVRPVLIGGTARLPFLWVLLGLFGGLEAFGLIGLFLGPMTMAALMSLWREWTLEPPAERSVL